MGRLTIKSPRICLAVYLAVAVFTFGNVASHPRVCWVSADYYIGRQGHWDVCHNGEEMADALGAAVIWPIYWPLRLSWELQQ